MTVVTEAVVANLDPVVQLVMYQVCFCYVKQSQNHLKTLNIIMCALLAIEFEASVD